MAAGGGIDPIHQFEIKPIIGGVYNLEDAETALKQLEDRKATGKIVLRVSADD